MSKKDARIQELETEVKELRDMLRCAISATRKPDPPVQVMPWILQRDWTTPSPVWAEPLPYAPTFPQVTCRVGG